MKLEKSELTILLHLIANDDAKSINEYWTHLEKRYKTSRSRPDLRTGEIYD